MTKSILACALTLGLAFASFNSVSAQQFTGQKTRTLTVNKELQRAVIVVSKVSQIARLDYETIQFSATNQPAILIGQLGQFNGGRLGRIRFDQGDIILSMGGVNVTTASDLDVMIDEAVRNNRRFFTVLNVRNGMIENFDF